MLKIPSQWPALENIETNLLIPITEPGSIASSNLQMLYERWCQDYSGARTPFITLEGIQKKLSGLNKYFSDSRASGTVAFTTQNDTRFELTIFCDRSVIIRWRNPSAKAKEYTYAAWPFLLSDRPFEGIFIEIQDKPSSVFFKSQSQKMKGHSWANLIDKQVEVNLPDTASKITIRDIAHMQAEGARDALLQNLCLECMDIREALRASPPLAFGPQRMKDAAEGNSVHPFFAYGSREMLEEHQECIFPFLEEIAAWAAAQDSILNPCYIQSKGRKLSHDGALGEIDMTIGTLQSPQSVLEGRQDDLCALLADPECPLAIDLQIGTRAISYNYSLIDHLSGEFSKHQMLAGYARIEEAINLAKARIR